MAAHPLTVGLRGSRDYVQGSQILARTAELVATENPEATIVAAKFTRITDHGVCVTFDDDAPAGTVLGSARFRVDGGERTVHFHKEAAGPAPRIDDVPPSTSDLTTSGDGVGRCAFAIDGDFESYLAAAIEFVKAVHAARAERVSDIWFTALAAAALPIEPIYARAGTLTITPKIERVVGERLQTLGTVETTAEGEGHAPAPFQISFSCVTD
jgi:hypothetical protein